jgi:hypothetical protein
MSNETMIIKSKRHLVHSVLPLFVFLIQHGAFPENAKLVSPAVSSAFKLNAVFSETIITVDWPEQEGIKACNVYADFGDGYVKVNPVPVASRPKFSLLWTGQEDSVKRIIKGNRICMYVAALNGDCTNSASECTELKNSDTICTDYFDWYSGIVTEIQCRSILLQRQTVPKILLDADNVKRQDFLKTFPALANRLAALYKDNINPAEEGACVPFSSIVAIYLSRNGIPCYRAEGLFISQFHSFNLVMVNGVEYVLDFTADQFLPKSVPMLIPRDCCSIGSKGKPVCRNNSGFTQMYRVERIISSDNIRFSDSPGAEKYVKMLESLEDINVKSTK